MLGSPVCHRRHRKTCFLVKWTLCQGWNLWFPGASPGPGVRVGGDSLEGGGFPGRSKTWYLPHGWKWLLQGGGGLSVPTAPPPPSPPSLLVPFKVNSCFGQLTGSVTAQDSTPEGSAIPASQLWASARQIPTSPKTTVENHGREFS